MFALSLLLRPGTAWPPAFPRGPRLNSALGSRHSPCQRLWRKLPAHGGPCWAAAGSQLAAALCVRPAGRLPMNTTCCQGDSWTGFHLEVSWDQNYPSLLALPPSVTQSGGLPSLQPRGMSQLRMPARERAPGWEQRAGGGSWRPCDRWRLCVSQGRAGPGSFLRSI